MKFGTCVLLLVICLAKFLFLYDFRQARRTNARRVSFTKELYGFTYTWKTKSGIRQKRKPGLIEECLGSEIVVDSAIIVPSEYKSVFDTLFSEYSDIMHLRVFEIVDEITY